MGTGWSQTSGHLPGVDGLVAVHQHHVAGEHASQCILPGLTGPLPPRHLGDLPRCSIGRTQAAVLDDVEQASDFTLIDLPQDRKSTRLNSSHLVISYAVFCLKKKKKEVKIVDYKRN